jgi:hypothetical protein
MIRLTPRQRHSVFSRFSAGIFLLPWGLLERLLSIYLLPIAFATVVVMFVICASTPSGLVAAHGRIEEKQRTRPAA